MSWSFAKNMDTPSEILTGTCETTTTTRSASEKHFATIPQSPTDCTRVLHYRAQAPNGRPLRDTATPDDREYWTDIWVQSFCLTPGKQRWFPVSVDKEPLPPDERRSAEVQEAILDEVKREYTVYQAKQER
ncbi:hypothetical protein E4U48_001597 [Claviceps purpurea]|nr:hypothetical protein E4U26_002696 [Claviceps purpurea]KAG6276512.1 hypothetical protein E4U48_001597 [Claviceps purpurea]